ncbi:MAG: ABC transporter substrate-binding protein, partial [Ardenticatenaceae bacterium]
MHKNHFLTLLTLLLVVTLALAACGSSGEEAEPGAETGEVEEAPAAESEGAEEEPAAEEAPAAEARPTTITWAFWGSPEEQATHESVADAFMQEHPDIRIEIWHQPWGDYFTKLQTLWASGDAAAIPDVMFLFPVPSYAADGVLENLDPWIQEAGYNTDDYWPALLESARFDGSLYGLPRDIGLEVLYYNKDLFDEVGLEYPTEEWTW